MATDSASVDSLKKTTGIQLVRRGGARPGAGRKPNTVKGVLKRLPRDSAELILRKIKALEKWLKLANSKDERIVFEVMKYLSDRAYGKPAQAVEHCGEAIAVIQINIPQVPPRPDPQTIEPDFGDDNVESNNIRNADGC